MTFIMYTNLRLILRAALFLWGLIAYWNDSDTINALLNGQLWEFNLFLAVTWLIMLLSIVSRFFPSSVESMGAQREHERNYVSREAVSDHSMKTAIHQGNRDAIRSLIFWVILNGVLFRLYWAKKITTGVLLLVSLFYSLADLICIRFFCPFQRWLMSNRCCTTCRIYNWDHMMIHTPTLLIPNPMAIPLWLGSAILAVRWEWRWAKHPERFLEVTNRNLSCGHCRHPGSCQSCVRKKRR